MYAIIRLYAAVSFVFFDTHRRLFKVRWKEDFTSVSLNTNLQESPVLSEFLRDRLYPQCRGVCMSSKQSHSVSWLSIREPI